MVNFPREQSRGNTAFAMGRGKRKRERKRGEAEAKNVDNNVAFGCILINLNQLRFPVMK